MGGGADSGGPSEAPNGGLGPGFGDLGPGFGVPGLGFDDLGLGFDDFDDYFDVFCHVGPPKVRFP